MHCYTSQLVAVWTFMMTSHFTTDKEYRSHLILPFQNAASGCVFDMYDWPKSSSYAEKWQRFKISKVCTQGRRYIIILVCRRTDACWSLWQFTTWSSLATSKLTCWPRCCTPAPACPGAPPCPAVCRATSLWTSTTGPGLTSTAVWLRQAISFIWWGTSLHFIEIGDQRITQVEMEWNDTSLSMRSRQEVTTHPPPVSKQRKGQLCSITSWQTQTFFFHLHFYKNWFLFEWEELPHVTQWPYLCPSEIGTVISEYSFTTFILFWSDRTWITGDNVRQWTNLSIVFRIFVIQQKDNETFNRAMLLNVGYTEAIKVADWDCLGKFISTADLKSFHMAWTQVFPLSLNNFLN